jgi:hypothetical protein
MVAARPRSRCGNTHRRFNCRRAKRSDLEPLVLLQLSPAALGGWQKAEITKCWPMIKAGKVKVD